MLYLFLNRILKRMKKLLLIIGKQIDQLDSGKNMSNIMKIRCLSNPQSKGALCTNTHCNHKAIVCLGPNCQSCPYYEHQSCKFVSAQSIQRKLKGKLSDLPQNIQQIFDAIQQIYSQAIQIMQKQREIVRQRRAYYGLSYQQIDFLRNLNQTPKLIKGSQVQKIIQDIQKSGLIRDSKNLDILGLWERQKIKLSYIINRVSNIGNINQMKRDVKNINFNKLQLLSSKNMRLKLQEQEQIELFDIFA